MEKKIVDRVLQAAKDIQQIPAPTFAEKERADYVLAQFINEGLVDARQDALGNVYGRFAGEAREPFVVVSAHTDTVFPQETDLTIKETAERISAPGIGDNSMGVAGLFGLLWGLQKDNKRLAGDVWLVANVGEEGLGDLNGMREVVKHFGDTPAAYIILEGMGLGRLFNRGLGVKRYEITAHTPGGHSWANYGNPSAIHELTQLVNQITEIELPTNPRTSMNVGIIEGGTTINTIASKASIQLDLRSVSQTELKKLAGEVESLVAGSNKTDVSFEIEVIGSRPIGEIADDHSLVKICEEVHAQMGIQSDWNIGSTDANIPLSMGLPAICMGLTTGGNPHRLDEYIHKAPLEKGLAILIKVVKRVFA